MILFCTCGYRNEYSGSRPKFCGSCGNPFDAAFKRAPVPTLPAVAASQPFQQQPQSHMGLTQPPQNDALPVLTANAFSTESHRTRRITLSESALKNLGDIPLERPSQMHAPSFGDDEVRSTASETRQNLAEMRERTLSQAAAQPSAKPARRSRGKSAK